MVSRGKRKIYPYYRLEYTVVGRNNYFGHCPWNSGQQRCSGIDPGSHGNGTHIQLPSGKREIAPHWTHSLRISLALSCGSLMFHRGCVSSAFTRNYITQENCVSIQQWNLITVGRWYTGQIPIGGYLNCLLEKYKFFMRYSLWIRNTNVQLNDLLCQLNAHDSDSLFQTINQVILM